MAINNKVSFEKIGIVFDERLSDAVLAAQKVKSILDTKNLNSELIEIKNLKSDKTFIIVTGGDGTLLKAVRFYSEFAIPVFGINLGRLGFLAQAKFDETQSVIEKILNNEFKIENRIMVNAVRDDFCALNDIVIKGESSLRTSRLYVYINDKFVCDYLADGLIISTPTGSTAYTLSAGGPVLTPSLEALVIVPICPHTLTARPLVIPSGDVIKIKSFEATHLQIIADGQNTTSVSAGQEIIVKKHIKDAKLLLLNKENNEFYSVLREKLHWGVSPKS